MRLRYILLILILGGAAYYYDLLPWKRERSSSPAVVKVDPGMLRSLKAAIRNNERAIAELQDQSRRAQRSSSGDTHSLDIRNKKIAQLERENAEMEARIGAAEQ
jgi:uncharacterized protein HemX